jgi:hypothetical protein
MLDNKNKKEIKLERNEESILCVQYIVIEVSRVEGTV